MEGLNIRRMIFESTSRPRLQFFHGTKEPSAGEEKANYLHFSKTPKVFELVKVWASIFLVHRHLKLKRRAVSRDRAKTRPELLSAGLLYIDQFALAGREKKVQPKHQVTEGGPVNLYSAHAQDRYRYARIFGSGHPNSRCSVSKCYRELTVLSSFQSC
jgi:hypothetical protein